MDKSYVNKIAEALRVAKDSSFNSIFLNEAAESNRDEMDDAHGGNIDHPNFHSRAVRKLKQRIKIHKQDTSEGGFYEKGDDDHSTHVGHLQHAQAALQAHEVAKKSGNKADHVKAVKASKKYWEREPAHTHDMGSPSNEDKFDNSVHHWMHQVQNNGHYQK